MAETKRRRKKKSESVPAGVQEKPPIKPLTTRQLSVLAKLEVNEWKTAESIEESVNDLYALHDHQLVIVRPLPGEPFRMFKTKQGVRAFKDAKNVLLWKSKE